MNHVIMLCSFVAFSALFSFFHTYVKNRFQTFLKVLSLVLTALFVGWYLLAGGNNLIDATFNYNNPFSSKTLCFFAGFSCWMLFAVTVLAQIFPFFKDKVLLNSMKTFGTIAMLFPVFFLKELIFTFTNSYGVSVLSSLIAIHVGLLFAECIFLLIHNDSFYVRRSELKTLFVFLLIVFIFSMPPYMPKFFFGNVGLNLIKGLKFYHRIYLYVSFIFLFGLYFILKKRESEYARMVLLFISLATLISYCYQYTYSIFITPTSWPLHLCNTAMFILPICLIFKLERLFYFTFFINVIGAFFAMLMPNYSSALAAFSTPVVTFWINHIMAFAMPVLVIMLKVYPRPKLKHFIYSMIVFVFYFLLVLTLNAWFTNYNAGVDFFFLNSDFIVTKLGKWAEDTRNIVWAFKIRDLTFTFYPLYQFLFFLVYVVLGLMMWFIYAWLFTLQDFFFELAIKNKNIKLDELILKTKYDKKDVSECMNEESKGKLVVKNLTKRYATSKVDVVSQINFEINEGDIIGFLGLNGAGKSTIIKCIVGIQPPTSGSIEINGYDIEKQPVEAKMQFGFVPDHYALYENLTGREYVNYIADLYEVSQEDRDARLEKLVKNLNMVESFDSQIKTYSHGMKQKITIMSALVHAPKLWILDEPLTGLDPISIYEVKECMRQHAKEKNIVFFSSHIIDVVEKLCNRIIILNNHKIVADVRTDEVLKTGESLEDFYLKTIGQKVEK